MNIYGKILIICIYKIHTVDEDVNRKEISVGINIYRLIHVARSLETF
jgi:hypothetical protein